MWSVGSGAQAKKAANGRILFSEGAAGRQDPRTPPKAGWGNSGSSARLPGGGPFAFPYGSGALKVGGIGATGIFLAGTICP
jgi:hypothetical protein